ncbi:hypothetical protein MATL_G00182920 [Megalops atlanticus]|uniref:Uncharacterized protein n=1 Tax=Megalops atlanticus TaxID=7932 RepID=A0A9D3PMM9_MEGAT|nr:hypothetical protein MATL_G00182920 [Megalops atlanticus]
MVITPTHPPALFFPSLPPGWRKIKEWVGSGDPGALVIPFSGGLESEPQDVSGAERQKYCEEHKTQREEPGPPQAARRIRTAPGRGLHYGRSDEIPGTLEREAAHPHPKPAAHVLLIAGKPPGRGVSRCLPRASGSRERCVWPLSLPAGPSSVSGRLCGSTSSGYILRQIPEPLRPSDSDRERQGRCNWFVSTRAHAPEKPRHKCVSIRAHAGRPTEVSGKRLSPRLRLEREPPPAGGGTADWRPLGEEGHGERIVTLVIPVIKPRAQPSWTRGRHMRPEQARYGCISATHQPENAQDNTKTGEACAVLAESALRKGSALRQSLWIKRSLAGIGSKAEITDPCEPGEPLQNGNP